MTNNRYGFTTMTHQTNQNSDSNHKRFHWDTIIICTSDFKASAPVRTHFKFFFYVSQSLNVNEKRFNQTDNSYDHQTNLNKSVFPENFFLFPSSFLRSNYFREPLSNRCLHKLRTFFFLFLIWNHSMGIPMEDIWCLKIALIFSSGALRDI